MISRARCKPFAVIFLLCLYQSLAALLRCFQDLFSILLLEICHSSAYPLVVVLILQNLAFSLPIASIALVFPKSASELSPLGSQSKHPSPRASVLSILSLTPTPISTGRSFARLDSARVSFSAKR